MIYVGDSLVRNTDARLNKDVDIVVCLQGARIEYVAERLGLVMGHGNGRFILVNLGTNNSHKEDTAATVEKYRHLLPTYYYYYYYYTLTERMRGQRHDTRTIEQ